MNTPRWDICVDHRGEDVGRFFADYLSGQEKPVLFIGGAGFDPRATAVLEILSANIPVEAVLIRELRPSPDASLLARAAANIERQKGLCRSATIHEVNIFHDDGAVIGARRLAQEILPAAYVAYSDVVIDLSALSIGTSFPLVRSFIQAADTQAGPRNVHLVVAHDPRLDDAIRPEAADRADYIHGFGGEATLASRADAAKLWMPQLSKGRKAILQRVFDFLKPDDTCPVLPFPTHRPRLPDELAEEYLDEIETQWRVDARNVIYAAEDDPLDLYRIALTLETRRKRVFDNLGGSTLILTPNGGKMLNLGALLAACERDMPIAYVETSGYAVVGQIPHDNPPELVHLWLTGDPYGDRG